MQRITKDNWGWGWGDDYPKIDFKTRSVIETEEIL